MPKVSFETCIVLIIVSIVLVGCATTNLPSFKETEQIRLQDDETRIWNRSKEEQGRLDSSQYLYHDQILTDYVNQIAQNLVPKDLADKGFRIEIKILKNPQLNAFAYPNGVIYVHTGILCKMENEAQLAALLGHEMTHVTHRHAIENFRGIKNTTAVLSTLQLVTLPLGVYGDLASILGSVGAMAAVSGYSKESEREADREGLQLMLNAGYDPREAPRLFEHLQQDIKEQEISEPYFFGSHPRLQERIDNYKRFLQDMPGDSNGVKNEERFCTHTTPLLLENAVLDLAMGRFQSGQRGIEAYLKRNPDDPRAFYWLGETYRQRNAEGDIDKAVRQYETALACDEGLPQPYKALGLIYYKQCRYEKARAYIERYIQLAPDAGDRGYMEQYIETMDKQKKGGRI
jgi:predicted Zn-dependent protease